MARVAGRGSGAFAVAGGLMRSEYPQPRSTTGDAESAQRFERLAALATDRPAVAAASLGEAGAAAVDHDAVRTLLVGVQQVTGGDALRLLLLAFQLHGAASLVFAGLIGDLAVVAGQFLATLAQVALQFVVALARTGTGLFGLQRGGALGFLDQLVGMAGGKPARHPVPAQDRHDEGGDSGGDFPAQGNRHGSRSRAAIQRPKMISSPSWSRSQPRSWSRMCAIPCRPSA